MTTSRAGEFPPSLVFEPWPRVFLSFAAFSGRLDLSLPLPASKNSREPKPMTTDNAIRVLAGTMILISVALTCFCQPGMDAADLFRGAPT